MENFQDRGVWIRIRIRFVLRGWIRIRSISDRIRNPDSKEMPLHNILGSITSLWTLLSVKSVSRSISPTLCTKVRRHFLNFRIILEIEEIQRFYPEASSMIDKVVITEKRYLFWITGSSLNIIFSKNLIFRDLSLAITGLLLVIQKRPANKSDCTLRSLAVDGLQWKGEAHFLMYFISFRNMFIISVA